MKKFNIPNINEPFYWDIHQTNTTLGMREMKYWSLIEKPNSKICDLGCGLSPFLCGHDVKTENFPYSTERWGIDFSPKTIVAAKEKYKDTNYIRADVCDVPIKDNYFDYVVCGEVIEHMEDPEKLLAEMERICKVGGKMILSTPHLEFEDPEHLWEFDEEYFTNRGFSVETVNSDWFKGRSYIFAWKIK